MEWNAKFQLEVIENKVVIIPPSNQDHGSPKIYPRTPRDPRLRMAAINCRY